MLWWVQGNIPLEEVFEQLHSSREGLTSREAETRLEVFGPNKLEEKTNSKLLLFLGFMWNPLSWVMEIAAIMALVLANGDVISFYHSSIQLPCDLWTQSLCFVFRANHQIGKILSELCRCWSSTPPLVSSKRTMQAMLLLLSWQVLHPRLRLIILPLSYVTRTFLFRLVPN